MIARRIILSLYAAFSGWVFCTLLFSALVAVGTRSLDLRIFGYCALAAAAGILPVFVFILVPLAAAIPLASRMWNPQISIPSGFVSGCLLWPSILWAYTGQFQPASAGVLVWTGVGGLVGAATCAVACRLRCEYLYRAPNRALDGGFDY